MTGAGTKSFDELRALLPENPDWLARCDRDERALAHLPAVTPDCPSWCRYEPGHAYDSVDFDGLTFIRDHVTHTNGPITITQEERNLGGAVTRMAPYILCYATEAVETDADGAIGLAQALTDAATLLRSIEAGQ